MVENLHQHPLVRHYLTILRDRETPASSFREASAAMTRILVIRAAERLLPDAVEVTTPLEVTEGARIPGPLVLVPILRAGLGMLDASMSVLPNVSVGYVGMERNEATAVASCYYNKTPDLAKAQAVFLLDPMLATGGSANQAIARLKANGAGTIVMVCVIAAPEGVDAVRTQHPGVVIVTGAVDRELNERKFILPGLGDFGDRLFDT